MLLLLPFVSSALLLPAGQSVRLSKSSKIARSSASRTRNSFPNGFVRQIAVNAGSASQAWLASPKVLTRAGKVGALLEAEGSLEEASGVSLPPLQRAIFKENVEVVKALLEAGALLEAERPLKRAIYCGNVEVVKALLEAGASLEAEGAFPGTPLKIAILKENVEVIKTLLEAGASLEAEGAFGGTPLEFAILGPDGNDAEVVKALVDAGASLSRSIWLVSPLELAIFNGNVNVMKVVFEATLTANPLEVAFSLTWMTYWVYLAPGVLRSMFGC